MSNPDFRGLTQRRISKGLPVGRMNDVKKVMSVNVKIGTSHYMTDPMGRHPASLTLSQFILVDGDGVPIMRKGSNGQVVWVDFKKLATARTRAREVHGLGEDHPEVGVFDKVKGQVVFAA